MFYVPTSDVPSKPGWSKQRLFLTDGNKPLLVAHVTSIQAAPPSTGMWAFANPSEFEHLLAGIAQNRDPYKITTLGVLLNSHMGVDSIIAEEVLDVATNANDAERRAFMVRTVEGNCYLLGDEILERTTFDVIIYQSSRHNDQWPKAHL